MVRILAGLSIILTGVLRFSSGLPGKYEDSVLTSFHFVSKALRIYWNLH